MGIRSSLAGLAVVLFTATLCQTAAASVDPLIAGRVASALFSAFGSKGSDPPACPAQFDDSLETNGIATDFRHGVTPPRAIAQPEPKLTDEARRVAHDEIARHQTKMWEKIVVVNMIVGEDGIPRDFCIRKPAGYGLESQAVKAAAQYRFEPAMSEGKPVRARIDLSVSFKIY